MTRTNLILRYTGFTVIAMIVNLVVQQLILLGGPITPWFMTVFGAGTFIGLVIKYLLDKRWVFMNMSSGAAVLKRKFGLYTAMGLITTAVFWGTESAFWFI